MIKSISKSYGVPGCRLGVMASGDRETIGRIRKSVPVWNINSFGEFFLQIMDKYSKAYLRACDELAAERERFVTELKKLDIMEVYPSRANYVLCRLRALDSHKLTERLLSKYSIFIKDLSGKASMPKGQYIRLAIRNEENSRLTVALRDLHDRKASQKTA